MRTEIIWENYKKLNPEAKNYEAWSFGSDPDELLRLVMEGTKTATASAYDSYVAEQEELPKVGGYSIILDTKGEAACIIQDTEVNIYKFKDVPEIQGYLEGEGDRSIRYWREVHEKVLKEDLKSNGIDFTEESRVVCEVFKVVYKDPDYK